MRVFRTVDRFDEEHIPDASNSSASEERQEQCYDRRGGSTRTFLLQYFSCHTF